MFKIILTLILTLGIAQASYIPPDVKVNMLVNGDFELPTLAGWTCSLGTPSINATTFSHGLNSMAVTSSGAGVRCYQSIATNAANLKGLQGSLSIDINSTDTALQVCNLVNGTTAAYDQNCVTVPVTDTNNPFKHVEIPFVMGGTSSGIVIKSATTSAQNIYLDDAKVSKGLVTGSLSVDTDRIAFVPTLTNFGNATATGFYKRLGDTASVQIRVTIGSSLPTGNLAVSIPSQLAIDTAKITPSQSASGIASGWGSSAQYIGLTSISGNTVVFINNATPTLWSATVPTTWAAGNVVTADFTVPILGWSSTSSVYSQANAKSLAMQTSYSANIYTTSGTLSQLSKAGWISGCTAANPTVCTLTGFTLTPNCTTNITANAAYTTIITAASASSISIESIVTTSGALAPNAPFTLSCQKVGVDYDNALSPSIVGSFAGYDTSAVVDTKIAPLATSSSLTTLAARVTALETPQTWQSPGRAFDTTYNNGTGRIIYGVAYGTGAGDTGMTATIGGVAVGLCRNSVSGGGCYGFFAVPPGANYSIHYSGTTFQAWMELR